MIWMGGAAARTSKTNPRLARPLIAARLKQAICHVEDLSSSCWDSHHELLFWMVGLGSCVAGPGDDQLWFIDRFVQLARLLQVGSTERMSDLFREYLYLEKFEMGDLVWLAGLVVQQRDFQTDTPWRDMRMSSMMTSSDDSTPSSDMGMSSMMSSKRPFDPTIRHENANRDESEQ